MRDDRDRYESQRWRSANQLSEEHLGSPEKTNRMLTALRLALITDISEQAGMAWENAAEIVEHCLIKRKGLPAKRGPKAILAADDAARMIALEYKTDVPRAEAEWKSANQLKDLYMGGLHRIAIKLEAAMDALVVDITEQTSLTEDEARGIVDRYFGGRRLPSGGGSSGLYAAPRLVEMLEQEGTLCRRHPKSYKPGYPSLGSDGNPPSPGGRSRG